MTDKILREFLELLIAALGGHNCSDFLTTFEGPFEMEDIVRCIESES